MKKKLYLCTRNSVTNIINSLTSLSVMAKLNNITISVSAFRSNEVDAYLNTIRKYKALPYEEEVELASNILKFNPDGITHFNASKNVQKVLSFKK